MRTHLGINENWNRLYKINHLIWMQNDRKDSINMNASYTVFRLSIQSLKNASWAGKSKRLSSWSQTGIDMDPQHCPSCRPYFTTETWSYTVLNFPQANVIVPAANWNVIEMCQESVRHQRKAIARQRQAFCTVIVWTGKWTVHQQFFIALISIVTLSFLLYISTNQSFLFGFTTLFTPQENNFHAYSFIRDGYNFPSTTMLFDVEVTSCRYQPFPKDSNLLLSNAWDAHSQLLYPYHPLIPVQWPFQHNESCQHTADMVKVCKCQVLLNVPIVCWQTSYCFLHHKKSLRSLCK